MTDLLISPGGVLRGALRVPGDKSISHRAVMLGAIAEGVTEVSGFLEGEDALATLQAFRAMGVAIEGPEQGRLRIEGVGRHGLRAPRRPLDMGNSGTSMRLLAGLLAGQSFDSELCGDVSLSRRPMRRIIDPLRAMGARIESTEAGTAPLRIHGGRVLSGTHYEQPVASAQVKSCLLLAGLYAKGDTTVVEPAPSRDHTERMLTAFGCPVQQAGGAVTVQGGARLQGTAIHVPADLSSAAFFLVGACLAPDSDVTLEGVGINPTRAGILTILELMGADIEVGNERILGGEPVADLRVRTSQLHGIRVPPELVPLAIDEFPALFIAAACAEGETVVTGAAELRVKESDRIGVMAAGLNALGVAAQPTEDGMVVRGSGAFGGGVIDSHHDHRIAMSFAMAALRAREPIRIRGCQIIETSFPGFVESARSLGLRVASS